MGNGGSTPVDVALQRTTTGTLTVLTNEVERVRVNSSGLQISGGYLKLATSANIPPAGDCNAANEVGRMKVDDNQLVLYVCAAQGTAVGWRSMVLPPG
jgi:hypothetical protein